jgi:uncharacterized membrane protein
MGVRPLRLGLAVVCLLTAATLALVAAIALQTGDNSHVFLAWNLFLAWIPLLFALALEWRRRRGLAGLGSLALGLGWLLFLPNAPYIATDLIHLGDKNPDVSVWLDLTTLVVGAACGGLAGFLSLVLVQRAIRERVGPRLAWALVVSTLALTSFGIYLGRIVRLNSWDVVTRPRLLTDVIARRLVDPLSYPKMLVGTAAVTIALLLAYVVFERVTNALDRRLR